MNGRTVVAIDLLVGSGRDEMTEDPDEKMQVEAGVRMSDGGTLVNWTNTSGHLCKESIQRP